jgi:cell division protein FtsZ
MEMPDDQPPDVTGEWTLPAAFQRADEALRQGVQAVSDVVTMPGPNNVEFADLKRLLTRAGNAILGIGQARGENCTQTAAEIAISGSHWLAGVGRAHSVLLTITAGPDLTLEEIYVAADVIGRRVATEETHFIMATFINEALLQDVQVTLLAANLAS